MRGAAIDCLLFLAALGCAAFGFSSPTGATRGYVLTERCPVHLRVATWNVGGQDGAPCSDAWLPDVAASLRQLDADLVFLQEVTGRDQVDDLLDRLGDAWQGRVTRGDDRQIAVLWQRGRIEVRAIRLPGRRAALEAVYDPADRPPVVAVCVHADAFDARRRNLQIGRALDRLGNSGAADARILLGDLNLDLDLDKRRDLFSNNSYRDVETYNALTEQYFDVGVGRGATARPDRRLDYIFTNARFGVVKAGPWHDQRMNEMDHDPVIADLAYTVAD